MNLTTYEDFEEYGQYFALDRRMHRRQRAVRQPRRKPHSVTLPQSILEQLEGEDDFVPSFTSSDNEQAMLREALGTFYHDNVITDVLARVKGGKEANVYCCQAHPATGLDLIAAKIYRPRMHRTMRNDALYREGRMILDTQGKEIVRDARLKRAIAKKTDFGKEVTTFSWIEHEYDMLQTLHAAGADVPRPIAHVGNAILMEYFGDVNEPAPTLNGVDLAPAEAGPMLERLLWHVELMLVNNRIHGDLSAYNVLYWQGKAVVIDFPQAVVALNNRSAPQLLLRDIQRLSQYFTRYGAGVEARKLAADLWNRFENADL